MSGMRGRLSSKRHVDDERFGGSAKAQGNSGMDNGRGNRFLACRHRGLREGYRTVEHQPPEAGIFGAGAKGERTGTSLS